MTEVFITVMFVIYVSIASVSLAGYVARKREQAREERKRSKPELRLVKGGRDLSGRSKTP